MVQLTNLTPFKAVSSNPFPKPQVIGFKSNLIADTVTFQGIRKDLNKQNNKHLFVFDLDGSFADGSDKEIKKVVQLIKDNHGILVYATGRTKDSLLEKIHKLETKKGIELPIPKYLIANHGQFIYKNMGNNNLVLDNDWAVRMKNTGFDVNIVKETMKKLGQQSKYKFSTDQINAFSNIENYKSKDPDFYSSKISYYEYGPTQYLAEYMISPELKDIDRDVTEALRQKGIECRILHDYFPASSLKYCSKDIQMKAKYRVDNNGGLNTIFIGAADKSDAVEFLRNKLGISRKKVIAAGNGGNDISLTNKGYWFICVKNAENILKEAINSLIDRSKIFFANSSSGTQCILEGIQTIFSKEK